VNSLVFIAQRNFQKRIYYEGQKKIRLKYKGRQMYKNQVFVALKALKAVKKIYEIQSVTHLGTMIKGLVFLNDGTY